VDTGAEADELLDLVSTERLRVKHVLITHVHEDHVAALAPIVAATGATPWSHEREPLAYPEARVFADNAYFHLGVIAIKCLPTWGHSPGQTTFYVQGLAWPLALCGDSLFSASVGGSRTHFADQVKNTRARIFSLPRDTVIGPGHGPLTTLAHERVHNPFFAPDRQPPVGSPPSEGPTAAPRPPSSPKPGRRSAPRPGPPGRSRRP
jgi:glyoxylase-like metal-dependent hydrolase (beta-lactamase superfamily II)